MSGRTRVTLPDGRRVIGFRKTNARRAPRIPLHLLPDWRLGFLAPAHTALLLPPGKHPSIFGVTIDPVGYVQIAGKRRDWVLNQAHMLLAEIAPDGVVSPIKVVLERGDELPPSTSGPARKGEVYSGSITWNGRSGTILLGRTLRPLRVTPS